MLKYHLYVSVSRLGRNQQDEEVGRIVDTARQRNKAMNVTGALIFSGTRFAQYIEGPAAAVDAIVDDIRKDSRHEQITDLGEGPIEKRKFRGWSLSYSGPSLYVDRHIKALVGGSENRPGRDRNIDQLMRLMRSLTESTETGKRVAPRSGLVSS